MAPGPMSMQNSHVVHIDTTASLSALVTVRIPISLADVYGNHRSHGGESIGASVKKEGVT